MTSSKQGTGSGSEEDRKTDSLIRRKRRKHHVSGAIKAKMQNIHKCEDLLNFLFYITVNWIFWGFGLLIGQFLHLKTWGFYYFLQTKQLISLQLYSIGFVSLHQFWSSAVICDGNFQTDLN